MSERVSLEEMSAQIRERQEQGRLHREEMYQRQLVRSRENARRWYARHSEDVALRARQARRKARTEEDAALIRRFEALAAAKMGATGELAELISEQERDQRTSHYAGSRWLVSLDDCDRAGRPYYETVAA